jgi:hypothetical protein
MALGDQTKAIDWVRRALAIYEAIEAPNAERARTRLAEWTAELDAG